MPRQGSNAFDSVLLGICLCVLVLRCTFTESPVSRMSMLSFSLFDLSHSLVVSTVLLFALCLWLLRALLRGQLVYRKSGLEWGLGLFAIVAVLSFLVAADKRAALSELVMVLSPVLMCLLLVQVMGSPPKLRLVLAVIAALGLVTAFECADQFFYTNQATIQQYREDPQRMLEPMGLETGSLDQFLFEHRLYSKGVNGFFTTRNSAGSFLLMAFMAALALSVEVVLAQRRHLASGVDNFICMACTGIILAALLLTKSKGAIAGLILATCGLAAFYRFKLTFKRHSRIIVLGALVLAAGGAITLVFYGLRHDRLPGGNSMLVRWQYWYATGQMIADHPWLGVGAGNFAYYYQQYKPPEAIESIADPHNLILSILAQYGPLGLVTFLSLIFLPLRSLISGSTPSRPSILSEAEGRPAKRLVYGFVFMISTFMLLARPLLSSLEFNAPMVVLLAALIHTLVFSVGLFFLNGLSLTDRDGSQTDSPILATGPVLFCMVLGIGLANMTDFALFEPGVWTCFWAMMACLIALTTPTKPKPVAFVAVSGRAKLISVLSLAICAALYLGVAVVPVIRSAISISQANTALSHGLPDRAYTYLRQAAYEDPLTDAAWYRNGRMYLHQYDQDTRNVKLLQKAKICFEEAISRNANNFKSYERLCSALDRLGLYEKARQACSRAAELYPGCARIQFKLARLDERLGQTDQAIAGYERTLSIEDSFRRQFQTMYPDRQDIVYRLDPESYGQAQQRLAALKKHAKK